MAFRDDRDAAFHRAEALERELAETREKLAAAERAAAASQDEVATNAATHPSGPQPAPRLSGTKPRKQPRPAADRTWSPAGMVFSLLVGPLLGGYIVYKALDAGAELEGGARAVAVDSRWVKGGAYPIIEVDGRRYECKHKTGLRTDSNPVVLYDRHDPTNCRLEGEVGKMTMNEKVQLGFGLFLIVSMLYVGFMRPLLLQRRV